MREYGVALKVVVREADLFTLFDRVESANVQHVETDDFAGNSGVIEAVVDSPVLLRQGEASEVSRWFLPALDPGSDWRPLMDDETDPPLFPGWVTALRKFNPGPGYNFHYLRGQLALLAAAFPDEHSFLSERMVDLAKRHLNVDFAKLSERGHVGGKYLVIVVEDVEPTIEGPFENTAARDKEARRQRQEVDPHAENGIFWMDVNGEGVPLIGAYSGGWLRGEDRP